MTPPRTKDSNVHSLQHEGKNPWIPEPHFPLILSPTSTHPIAREVEKGISILWAHISIGFPEANSLEEIPLEACVNYAATSVRVFASNDPKSGALRAGIIHTFLKTEVQADKEAHDERAPGKLGAAVEKYLATLCDKLADLPCSYVTHAATKEEGKQLQEENPYFFGPPAALGDSCTPYEADEVYATLLEGIGKVGKQLADNTRETSQERIKKFEAGEISPYQLWIGWLPDENGKIRRLHGLIHTLWCDQVQPQLAREQKNPAGIITSVAESVTRFASKDLRLDKDINGKEAILRPNETKPKHGRPIVVADPPTMDTGLLDEVIIKRGLTLVGGHLVWPFLEWLIDTAHRQKLNGVERSDIITREGGWVAIVAEILGIDEDKAHGNLQNNLRTLARTLANLPIRWSDGARSSALFLLNEEAATAGRGRGRARITFKLVDRLLDSETFRARKRYGAAAGPEQWAGWRIVPLVRPHVIAPLPRSPRDTYGPQALFPRKLWLHFTEHGYQLLKHDGITVTPADIETIATFCQLPDRLALPVFNHLVEQGVIQNPSPDRYRPADQAATDFIREGWKISKERGSKREEGSPSRKGPK